MSSFSFLPLMIIIMLNTISIIIMLAPIIVSSRCLSTIVVIPMNFFGVSSVGVTRSLIKYLQPFIAASTSVSALS